MTLNVVIAGQFQDRTTGDLSSIMTGSVNRLAVDADKPVCTTVRDIMIPHCRACRSPSRVRRRQFFPSRSFRTTLSNMVSARRRFSFAFLSSSDLREVSGGQAVQAVYRLTVLVVVREPFSVSGPTVRFRADFLSTNSLLRSCGQFRSSAAICAEIDSLSSSKKHLCGPNQSNLPYIRCLPVGRLVSRSDGDQA